MKTQSSELAVHTAQKQALIDAIVDFSSDVTTLIDARAEKRLSSYEKEMRTSTLASNLSVTIFSLINKIIIIKASNKSEEKQEQIRQASYVVVKMNLQNNSMLINSFNQFNEKTDINDFIVKANQIVLDIINHSLIRRMNCTSDIRNILKQDKRRLQRANY